MKSKDLTNILAGAVLSSLAVLTSGCYIEEAYLTYPHSYYTPYQQRRICTTPSIIIVPRQPSHHYSSPRDFPHPGNHPHSRPFNNLPYGNHRPMPDPRAPSGNYPQHRR